jgi:lysophospholipase L1-like esterase
MTYLAETPTISLAGFGESTFRGVGDNPDFDNAYRVPDMVGAYYGVGVGQSILKVDNLAISGRTIAAQESPGAVYDAQWPDKSFTPGSMSEAGMAIAKGHIALINMGINDALQGVAVADFRSKILVLIQRCWYMGRHVVIQCPPKINSSASPAIINLLAQYRSMIHDLPNSLPVVITDPSTLQYGQAGAGNDTFHPDNTGYQLMRDDIIVQIGAQRGSNWIDTVNRQYQVCLMYTSVLKRLPESAGLDWWVGQLASNSCRWNDGTLADAFLQSAEAQAIYSGSNDTFVRAIYVNIFDRVADQSEVDYWIGRLANGESRGKIISVMIHSGATYCENGGRATDAVRSQRYICNRAAIGMSYAAVRRFPTIQPQSYLLPSITDDPLTVMNAGKSLDGPV